MAGWLAGWLVCCRDFFFGPSTNEFYSRLNGKTDSGTTVVGKGVAGGKAQDASAKTTTATKFCAEINNFFDRCAACCWSTLARHARVL